MSEIFKRISFEGIPVMESDMIPEIRIIERIKKWTRKGIRPSKIKVYRRESREIYLRQGKLFAHPETIKRLFKVMDRHL
jgi:hypothetical protein